MTERAGWLRRAARLLPLAVVAVGAAVFLTPRPSASADSDWVAVREVNLEVAAGSPLDFSSFLKNAPIDASNRLVINAAGRFARADAPDAPARLMCASLAWSPASGGFPDHDGARRYALQLKRHGYDIARFHHIDGALMFGRQKDFDFDPEVFDRIHYLMAELKKNGIHWMVDGLSSWRGAYGGYDDRWEPATDIKLRVLIDDEAFEHWRRLITATLKTVNPYTKIAPIDDPALALIVPINEGGIEFDSVSREQAGQPHYSPLLKPKWNEWLRARYGATAKLAAAWGQVPPGERLENGSVNLPPSRHESSRRMRDTQAFFSDVEIKATARMTKVLRDLGYKGPVSPWNNWPTIQSELTRRTLDAVTLNTYQGWVNGYAPGSKIGELSSFDDGANYVRMAAGARWLGKPFVVTEYDQMYWSRRRFEAGAVFPAYAALQGFDAICRHGHGPLILEYGEPFPHKTRLLPNATGTDPVARASETLAALLFRRGDVAEARATVPFAVRGEEDLPDTIQTREPEALTRIGLVSRIGLEPAAEIRPGEAAVGQPRDRFSAVDILASLAKSGAIPPGSADIGAGVAVSDTGQIRLDTNAKRITVATPMTEAIAFAGLSGEAKLGVLTVGNATSGALLSASSIDGRPLATSRKILIVYATDARGTDMRFRDAAETIIEDYGKLPARIRRGELDLGLSGKGAWLLSRVGLDGAIGKPIAAGDGDLKTRLSNVTAEGPTTYFLVERPEGL